MGNENSVATLIQLKANLDVVDSNGWTPLTFCEGPSKVDTVTW